MPKAFRDSQGNWHYTVKYQVGTIDGAGGVCPNERRDVMLVQYLLGQTALIQGRAGRGSVKGGGIGVKMIGKPPAVDGIFGRDTHYAILVVSLDAEASGLMAIAPGYVIRHVRDGRVFDSNLGFYINELARLNMGPARFNALPDLPDVPLELRTKLKEQSKSLLDD